MTREVIIHIGTTKTGSTSVQAVLSQHRAALAAQGVCYPVSPGSPAHTLLCPEAVERHRSGRRLDIPARADGSQGARLDAFRTEFAAEMGCLPPTIDRVLLSDERLSYILHDAERIATFQALLRPYFSKFTVLVYVRDQAMYLASRYAHLLRLGLADDVAALQSRDAPEKYYDYDALLRRWEQVFGYEAMQPRIYDEKPGQRFDTVADFLSVCRVALAAPQGKSFPRISPSISFAGQQVLQRLGRVAAEDNQKLDGATWRYLADAVRRAHPGQGWLPSRAEADAFMAPYRDSNERVRARYFPERESLFQTDYGRLPESPMAMTDAELCMAACRAMIAAVPVEARTADAKADALRLQHGTKTTAS